MYWAHTLRLVVVQMFLVSLGGTRLSACIVGMTLADIYKEHRLLLKGSPSQSDVRALNIFHEFNLFLFLKIYFI